MSKTIRFMLHGTFTIAVFIFVFSIPLITMALNLLFSGDFLQSDAPIVYVMLFPMFYTLSSRFSCSYTQIALTVGTRRRDILLSVQIQILRRSSSC